MCELPAQAFQNLIAAFPSAQQLPGSAQFTVNCDERAVEGSIDFTFMDKVIHVPYADFIHEQGGLCYLGAVQATGKLAILLGSRGTAGYSTDES